MKYLALLCVAFCVSCASMAAVGQLGQDIAALKDKPYLTEEDVAPLEEGFAELEAAVEADKAAGKGFLEGLSGTEAGGGALGLIAAAVAAANIYRNRNLPGAVRKSPKA